jgi:hypothetical protein
MQTGGHDEACSHFANFANAHKIDKNVIVNSLVITHVLLEIQLFPSSGILFSLTLTGYLNA